MTGSILSHVTIGTNDVARAKKFYDAVFAPLGLLALSYYENAAIGYGRKGDERSAVWVMKPFDGRPATWGNGSHFAFDAPNRKAVEEFHAKALALGGMDEGQPGPRPDYGPNYFGAYVRDPDGNKLQAVCHASA